MTPLDAIFQKMGQLLAADTATLAPAANPPEVWLIKEPFVPSSGLIPADLTPADFDGYAVIACIVGAQLQGVDPLTGDSIVEMKVPAGGWRWETTGLTNLPQTIYGFALVNNGATLVYGSELLATPVVLNGINQVVQLSKVTFRQRLGSVV